MCRRHQIQNMCIFTKKNKVCIVFLFTFDTVFQLFWNRVALSFFCVFVLMHLLYNIFLHSFIPVFFYFFINHPSVHQWWSVLGARKTYHSRPGRQAPMLRKPPAAGRGSRAPAFARAPGPTHRNSESLLGSDEHLKRKIRRKMKTGRRKKWITLR